MKLKNAPANKNLRRLNALEKMKPTSLAFENTKNNIIAGARDIRTKKARTGFRRPPKEKA